MRGVTGLGCPQVSDPRKRTVPFLEKGAGRHRRRNTFGGEASLIKKESVTP